MVNQGTLDTASSSPHVQNHQRPILCLLPSTCAVSRVIKIKGLGARMCFVLFGRVEEVIRPGFGQALEKKTLVASSSQQGVTEAYKFHTSVTK